MNLPILKEKWNSCTQCDISINKKIWGKGNHKPVYLFLNKYTNTTEIINENNRRILKDLLDESKIPISECYLENIILCKCNKKLSDEYEENCSQRIIDLIKILNPKCVVLFGNQVINFYSLYLEDKNLKPKFLKTNRLISIFYDDSAYWKILDIFKEAKNI